jgi:ABC-2 type transport system permease protein
MSRTVAVLKREYTESVRTKTFLLGTIFGPVVLLALLVVPILLASRAGGDRSVVVVDAGSNGLGQQIAQQLETVSAMRLTTGASRSRGSVRFHVRVQPLAGQDSAVLRDTLEKQITAKTLDGYLWVPADVAAGRPVEYVGRSVTNFAELSQVRAAVQSSVQQRRLTAEGIDATAVTSAMSPVPFEARKAGGGGTPEVAFFFAYILGFLVYMVVIMYGNAVMRGVLEEKRDRIVEIVVSSIRAEQLMLGKVLGIGAAGLLQVLVWIGFAAVVIRYGGGIAARFGAELPTLPALPTSFAVLFVVFFMGGFLLYSTLYAAMGAIATTDQEAQQMQFPVLIPLLVAILIQQSVIADPDGPVAVWGSLIPFTSPVIMPTRAYLTGVPPLQMAAAIGLLVFTCFALVWLAAKIYRIGILATGKRPGMAELWRWLRTA